MFGPRNSMVVKIVNLIEQKFTVFANAYNSAQYSLINTVLVVSKVSALHNVHQFTKQMYKINIHGHHLIGLF